VQELVVQELLVVQQLVVQQLPAAQRRLIAQNQLNAVNNRTQAVKFDFIIYGWFNIIICIHYLRIHIYVFDLY
jgi:hypothetical protein